MKFYFLTADSETCCTLDSVKDHMRFNSLTEIEVYEAVRVTGSDYFFCTKNNQCGEKGNCGKWCNDYQPRNGKNGCCKFVGVLYEHGNLVTIRLKNIPWNKGKRKPEPDQDGVLWCNCDNPKLTSNAGGRGQAFCLLCSTPWYH